jgi:hypothetical protein
MVLHSTAPAYELAFIQTTVYNIKHLAVCRNITQIIRFSASASEVAFYDPGASEVNQLNRIKLMLAVAFKNLQSSENTLIKDSSVPRDAVLPEQEKQLG